MSNQIAPAGYGTRMYSANDTVTVSSADILFLWSALVLSHGINECDEERRRDAVARGWVFLNPTYRDPQD